MNLEAWLANLGLLERLSLATIALGALALLVYQVAKHVAEERREAKTQRANHQKQLERRLSLLEEENRDWRSLFSDTMSLLAETVVLLKHATGGNRKTPPELHEIEAKVAAIRAQLRENGEKYDDWSRDEAKRRERE